MHVRVSLLLASLAFAFPISAFSQAQNQTQQPIVRTRDGGTSGRMESIFVPPMAGAPFSLTLVAEWSRPLANGGTFTLANQRRIVRDGKGRIYQERWVLVPKGSKVKSYMDVIQITDPAQHTWYNCGVQEKDMRPAAILRVNREGVQADDRHLRPHAKSARLPSA